jgi:hypothetical protein
VGLPREPRAALSLPEGEYEVRIDSTLTDGSLTYAEAYFEGDTADEILISSHTCHLLALRVRLQTMGGSSPFRQKASSLPENVRSAPRSREEPWANSPEMRDSRDFFSRETRVRALSPDEMETPRKAVA